MTRLSLFAQPRSLGYPQMGPSPIRPRPHYPCANSPPAPLPPFRKARSLPLRFPVRTGLALAVGWSILSMFAHGLCLSQSMAPSSGPSIHAPAGHIIGRHDISKFWFRLSARRHPEQDILATNLQHSWLAKIRSVGKKNAYFRSHTVNLRPAPKLPVRGIKSGPTASLSGR
jgi:hypothetical protein